MRILYLTQWFDPEPAHKGLTFAKALKDRGHDIEVVTGFPNYPTGKLYRGYRVRLYCREVMDGVVVHRLPLYPSHDHSSAGRIANYVSFFLSAVIYCTACARKFDAIYAYPPVPAWLAAAIAGWLTRRPCVIDIQDLWPDSVVKTKMRGTKRMESILNTLCNFIYSRAACIVCQSHGIRRRLVERGVPDHKLVVIYNWADESAAAPGGLCDLAPYGFEGRFNIVFGGNLGRVQGLDTLVRAANLAHSRTPQVQLLLIGDGIEGDNLRSLVHELGAENVKIAPAVARNQIGDVFAAADVLIFHLWDDPLFEITIPSKTQFYMAMGKPIIAGVKGDAADIVTRAGAGIAATPQNVGALADAMVQMAETSKETLRAMGQRAKDAYWASFSFATAISATESVLHSVVAERETP